MNLTTTEMGLQRAQTLVNRAIEIGFRDFSRPICVSICDAQGFLLSFGRADGAPVRSIEISQRKAYTCARMGVSTEAFLARLKRDAIDIGYFCDERFTALPGGVVLKNAQGQVLGGVGISGLTSAEDHVIADALAQIAASGAA